MKKPGFRKLARAAKDQLRWAGTGGYTRHSRIHYSAAPYPLRDYLPDKALMKLNDINGELSNRVLKDKLLFRFFMDRHFRIPEIPAFIEKGRLYPHPGYDPGGDESGKVRDLERLRAYCEASPGVVLKPSDGRAGMGVIGLGVGKNGWRVNGEAATPEDVRKLVARLDNYLVTARAPQAAYAEAVFPGSANSLHIVTMQDLGRGGEPFIAVAYQKFGSYASVPTDNWSAGGLRSEIDLGTGELGPAIKKYLKKKSQHIRYDRHPETGGQIAGVVVPNWPQLKAQLLAALAELSFLRLVGWDLLVQDDGFCILEGNTRPSLISLQATRPILSDPRARRFLEHHGIVRGGAR